ncbi:MAG: ATP-dependent DNA helicase RecG, partial [Candidatus Saccharimonadales bacterium]
LRALESSSDGFELAELDLEIRGPGTLYGQMQSGQLDLRVANLADTRLIAAARNAAKQFIEREKLSTHLQLAVNVKKLQAVTNLN